MRVLLTIAVLAAAWTANAQGTSEGIVSHSNATPAVTSVSATVGWTFQPTDWMAITDLGCFNDIFLNNQTVASIQVGLWTADGTLLASNSISSSSALFNDSRYESITPVGLNAGQVYHIGAYSPAGSSISVEVCGPAVGGSISTGTKVQLRATASNTAGFGFPAEITGTDGLAYLAPNYRYGVPEPSSGILLGLGALLMVVRRRQQLR